MNISYYSGKREQYNECIVMRSVFHQNGKCFHGETVSYSCGGFSLLFLWNKCKELLLSEYEGKRLYNSVTLVRGHRRIVFTM